MLEQDERKMSVVLEGRGVELVMDRPGYLELKRERMGWRGKHALWDEGKMLVDLWHAGRKVQTTERREARELRGES